MISVHVTLDKVLTQRDRSGRQRLRPILSRYTDMGPTSPSTGPVMPGILAARLLDCPLYKVLHVSEPWIQP